MIEPTKLPTVESIDRHTILSSPLTDDKFLRPDGMPFWQFLEIHDIPFQKKDFPFLTNYSTPRIKPSFDFKHYMELSSRGEALSYLYSGLGRALNYVGPVLDMEMKHGFNDHTDRHTLWVSQTGVELLQRSGHSYDGNGYFDEKTEVLMTLVGMTHDLGNLQTRKEHSTYSAWLLTKLFENTVLNEQEFRTALFSILFHEEPVLGILMIAGSCSVLTSFSYQTNMMVAASGSYSAKDFIKFGGPLLLLIMATAVPLATFVVWGDVMGRVD